MSDFDAADCLARYFELVRARPELYVNPPGDIYEILLEPAQIARAQADAAQSRRAAGRRESDTRVGVLADDPYVLITRDAVKFADGSYGLYNRLMVSPGVAMLPVLDDRIVLLHRFRHGTRMWHLEAPRGMYSGVGTHDDEARREVDEEIGGHVTELIHLGNLHATSGVFDEAYHLYMARIDRVGVPDKHEAVSELVTLTVEETERKIADNTITDGPTLALFLRARLRGLL